jgi:hypothetical protein
MNSVLFRTADNSASHTHGHSGILSFGNGASSASIKSARRCSVSCLEMTLRMFRQNCGPPTGTSYKSAFHEENKKSNG